MFAIGKDARCTINANIQGKPASSLRRQRAIKPSDFSSHRILQRPWPAAVPFVPVCRHHSGVTSDTYRVVNQNGPQETSVNFKAPLIVSAPICTQLAVFVDILRRTRFLKH